MNRFISLLRAMMSQDMNLFRVKAKKKGSMLGDMAMPLLLVALVMFAVGSTYYPVAMELKKVELTHIILTISIFLPSILLVFEGMYKTQSILFSSKDTELLFSLPISKKMIILARIIKLYVFQLAYNTLFTLPGFAIYAFYERPSAYFYIISALFLLLMPIIPTIVACFIGYFTKKISVNFKFKKQAELLLTFALVTGIMLASFNMQGIIQNFLNDAERIDSNMTMMYSPIYFYKELIKEFNLLNFLILIGMNILVVALFIFATKNSYFKIASKDAEKISNPSNSTNLSTISFKKNSKLKALVIKEFKKYFSSTIYVFNTMFGLILMLIFTISICTRFTDIVQYITEDISAENLEIVQSNMHGFYMAGLSALSLMVIITASSISIEGKSFYISKTLPVDVDKILLAKIIMSDLLTIPVMLICDLIVLFFFKVKLEIFLLIILLSFIMPSISAVYGLLINLRFPKMDASSDAEVVKQSKSTMVATLGGIVIAGAVAAITVATSMISTWAIAIEVFVLALILWGLWLRLKNVGKKRYRAIEV